MCRAIVFLAVLAGSAPMPASAQGPSEPIKAMGRMTREGLLIEYIVVRQLTETRVKAVKLEDGTTKTETYAIDVPVLEPREMLLTKFEVTSLDGTRVLKERFAAKMKEKAAAVAADAARTSQRTRPTILPSRLVRCGQSRLGRSQIGLMYRVYRKTSRGMTVPPAKRDSPCGSRSVERPA